MDLVLLRHAKAEDRTPVIADESRKLTSKGCKKAKAVAKGLLCYLKNVDRAEIWHSHARRSRQTAEIMAEFWGDIKLREFPAIYTGCLEELITELRQVPEDYTVIVVGHEPYLNIWSRQLTGIALPFKKCAAACFSLELPELAQGSLQWFASPKTLVKIGEKPLSERR
jgi:phosphohistidine phosphatase